MSLKEVLEDKSIFQVSSVYAPGCPCWFNQTRVLFSHVLKITSLKDVGGVWCIWDRSGSTGGGP